MPLSLSSFICRARAMDLSNCWLLIIGSSQLRGCFQLGLCNLVVFSLLVTLLFIVRYQFNNNPTSISKSQSAHSTFQHTGSEVYLLTDFNLSRMVQDMKAGLLKADAIVNKRIISYKNRKKAVNRVLESLYFSQITQNHAKCGQSRRIGDTADGGWDLCMSKPFNPIDVNSPNGCIAFSFGINYVYKYDDILAGEEFKCTVRMFDPSMTNISDYRRGNRRQWFYRKGLAGKTEKAAVTGWQLYTLCDLFDEFVEPGRPIDILKIDIELWEWESFETALNDGCIGRRVKQLIFETHTTMPSRKKLMPEYYLYVRVWLGLLRAGFRMWYWHQNPLSFTYRAANGTGKMFCCYEHYMLNWNFVPSTDIQV